MFLINNQRWEIIVAQNGLHISVFLLLETYSLSGSFSVHQTYIPTSQAAIIQSNTLQTNGQTKAKKHAHYSHSFSVNYGYSFTYSLSQITHTATAVTYLEYTRFILHCLKEIITFRSVYQTHELCTAALSCSSWVVMYVKTCCQALLLSVICYQPSVVDPWR